MDTQEQPRKTSSLLIPAAIVLAGLMIAAAFFITRSGASEPTNDNPSPTASRSTTPEVRPVGPDDHILGNPEAKIVIIEYSDFECPFCGGFHDTMHEIIDTYGPSGDVAWVYRHFPIEALHKQAWREAIASECAAEQGGNDAFWAYADLIFENNNGGNDGLDLTLLSDFAEQIGLSREVFNACMESERTRPLVQEDYDEAVNGANGGGTPHNVIIAGGQSAIIPGAQPLSTMKALISSILQQI